MSISTWFNKTILGKTDEELAGNAAVKDIEANLRDVNKINDLVGKLGETRANLDVILIAAKNSINQKQRRGLNVSAEIEQAHDAIVAILAAEELKYDLRTVDISRRLDKAVNKMARLAGTAHWLSAAVDVTRRDVRRGAAGMEVDPTDLTYCDRAYLVDRTFVDEVLQNLNDFKSVDDSIEEAIQHALERLRTATDDGLEKRF